MLESCELGFSLAHRNWLNQYPSWMPHFESARRPGRRPRNPIDALFARIWFYALKVVSGLSTAYAIDKLHDGTAECLWPRRSRPYELGERVPEKFVGIVESRFPGTSRYFNTPLRWLLSGEAVTTEWVEAQLVSLPKEIVDLLLVPLPDHLSGLPVAVLRPFDDQQARRLASLEGWHSLEAAVLLMKLGELNSTPELRRLARETFIRARPTIMADPVLSSFADELFARINDAFPLWIFPRPGLRVVVNHPAAVGLLRTALSPDALLELESSPRTVLAALRIEMERRLLEARVRASAQATPTR